MHVDLKGFLLLQIFFSILSIVLLLAFGVAWGTLISVLPDIVGQGVLFLTACVFYSVAFTEEPFNKHKHLHGSMAVLLTLALVSVDLALDFWFAFTNQGSFSLFLHSFSNDWIFF